MDETIETWFNSPERLQSVAVGAVVFYLIIIIMARLTGKRTTGQMNNFDWLVTVAVGSLAASGILLRDVSIADAALAIIIIFALQWLTTWLVLRSPFMCRLIKPKPRLLLDKGGMLKDAMHKERISEAELYTAMREEGLVNLEEANWVILENNGKMTVIKRRDVELEDAKLMENVEHERA